jgi:hypothetical protein
MLSPSSRSIAKPAAAWLRQLAEFFCFYLVDETQSRQRKCSVGLVKLSQPPQVLLYFED